MTWWLKKPPRKPRTEKPEKTKAFFRKFRARVGSFSLKSALSRLAGDSRKMEVEAKRKLLAKVRRGLGESVIVVEGKRDERALRETLAPTAETVKAGGRSADAVARRAVEAFDDGRKKTGGELTAEKTAEQKIVVLTDFDAEGERHASEITDALNALGVAPDASLRRNFVRLLGVKCVEDAPTALERLGDALESKTRKTNMKNEKIK